MSQALAIRSTWIPVRVTQVAPLGFSTARPGATSVAGDYPLSRLIPSNAAVL
jgi:hypothetical protein